LIQSLSIKPRAAVDIVDHATYLADEVDMELCLRFMKAVDSSLNRKSVGDHESNILA